MSMFPYLLRSAELTVSVFETIIDALDAILMDGCDTPLIRLIEFLDLY